MTLSTRTLLLSLATAITAVSAQRGHGPPGPWGPGPFGGGDDNDDDFASQYGPGANADFAAGDMESRRRLIIAHGVLAALAFVIFFPLGSILIRLGSFPGLWLIHGLFQLFAYAVYLAAFGIGIWMINSMPIDLLDNYHPTIGIVLFALLFFQPILGFVHHLKFKKYSRRTVWSHGHLWLGRIIITLGMINGGLGLLLASDAPAFTGFVPSRGHMIAYGVVAGIMWLLWVAAAVHGERKKSAAKKVVVVKEVETDLTPTHTTNKEYYAHRNDA